jgi:hypothetical protein
VVLLMTLFALGCSVAWDLPKKSFNRRVDYEPNQVSTKSRRIPPVLLDDPDLGAMAMTCAITANRYANQASDNSLWSTALGTLEVAGVGIGAVAASAAFASSDGKVTSTAEKTSIIGFAAGAVLAAVDQATSPAVKGTHQSQVSLKIGNMILRAAEAAAVPRESTSTRDGGSQVVACSPDAGSCNRSTPKQNAMQILAGCQDPSFVSEGDVGMLLPDTSGISKLAPATGGVSDSKNLPDGSVAQ